VDQGRALYQANGCASCHGASGRGDGPLAANLSPSPANLRDPANFKKGASEVEIAKTLAEGVAGTHGSAPQFQHNHHDLAMPKFDHLSELERRSIALYVISMQKEGS
jgi:high-affinity iron transporter